MRKGSTAHCNYFCWVNPRIEYNLLKIQMWAPVGPVERFTHLDGSWRHSRQGSQPPTLSNICLQLCPSLLVVDMAETVRLKRLNEPPYVESHGKATYTAAIFAIRKAGIFATTITQRRRKVYKNYKAVSAVGQISFFVRLSLPPHHPVSTTMISCNSLFTASR